MVMQVQGSTNIDFVSNWNISKLSSPIALVHKIFTSEIKRIIMMQQILFDTPINILELWYDEVFYII